MDITEALNIINNNCDMYVSEEINDNEFRNVLGDISSSLWQNKDTSLSMIELLLDNEDLYDISLEKNQTYSQFICGFIPDVFWNNSDNILGLTQLMTDYSLEYCECVELQGIFDHIPNSLWENRSFTLNICDTVTELSRIIDDLNRIDELIPDFVFNDTSIIHYTIRSLCKANDLNSVEFYMFPQATWNQSETIILALSILENVLDGDSYNMYPAFRRSQQDYLSDLISYVPESFQSDKDFISEVLTYHYFSESFHIIYDWIDKKLWEDKEFVMSVLKEDLLALLYVSEQLVTDDDIKNLINEKINTDDILYNIPEDKLPQWIKDLIS